MEAIYYDETKREGLGMESAEQHNSLQKVSYIIVGLVGISLIIIIHEIGHFLCAQLCGVPTPVFSLGFGPTICGFSIGTTFFKLSLLPFGGYVEIDPTHLAAVSYLSKMLILFGGIIFNFIFAYAILTYYIICNRFSQKTVSSKQMIKEAVTQIMTKEDIASSVIGPIGIISIIGRSYAVNQQCYWLILAVLSLNMGLLNIIPLPFFDGGKALLITIEAIIGAPISPYIVGIISMVFLVMFVAFITRITMNDIRRLIKG